MTDKYTAYLQLLHQRDLVMIYLASMAITLILGWELGKRLPAAWWSRLRPVYLVGGLALYILTVGLIALVDVP